MATEIELKLALSPKAARALPQHPLLAGISPLQQRMVSTYFDTPDLALKARHVGVRLRQKGWQWLQTVKSAEPASGGLAQRSEWETPGTPGSFDFSEVNHKDLRLALEDLEHRLAPVFTTDFKRLAWIIPFGNSEIEMALDRGHIISQGRKEPICEVELELVTGYIGDVFALARQLQDAHHLHPTLPSKAERGYALFLAENIAPFKAPAVQLQPDMAPVHAFRHIALTCLEHLQRNEAGATSHQNPEFIHQARVALRRLRSAIRLFAPVLPTDFVTTYSQVWKALATALGEARNWDVFIEETLPTYLKAFPEDKPAKRLLKESQRRANKARRSVQRLLTLPEYSRLLVEFTAATLALHDQTERSLSTFAKRSLKNRAQAVRRLVQRNSELTAAERHRMRIQFKKLRYALEFLSSLLTTKHFAPYQLALSRLQDTLGLINDHVTALNFAANHSATVRIWLAGRQELLLTMLEDQLDHWIEKSTPWAKTHL